MHGISPEDRLWLVKLDQAERRDLTTADRMAAARGRAGDVPAEATSTRRSPVHRSWVAVSQALHAIAHPHVHVPLHRPSH